MNSTGPRKILITGAAGGLGSALAQTCAARGCQVLLLDKDLRGLESVCDKVEADGGQPPGYCQVDLATAGPDQFEELVKAFTDTYGGLDGLVHCAAHFSGLQPMEQVPGDDWLRHLQVNLNAAWLLTRTCLPAIRSSSDGVVVFVLDEVRRTGSAYWGPYGVSKAGVREMAEIFANELEGSNCKVFGVSPGAMRTAVRATAYHAEDPLSQPTPQRAAEHIADLLTGKGENEVIQQVRSS
jgi:NAD(P)-dependent dehydrogenase (short-subunit alcohol dehydrogenase family)